MPVTEALMRPGFGTVNMIPETPYSITKQITDLIEGVGCHVVITPVPMGTDLGSASLLASALYTGRVTARPTRTQIDFMGLSTWLDTVNETDITRTTGTPTQWLGDLLLNGLSAGTVTGGSNVTHTLPAYAQTHRGGLDLIAEMGSWEYDVRPDFTVNAGTYSNLFESPPRVVITARAEGDDGTYFGLLGSIPGPMIDASNPATKVVAIGQGDGQAIAYGSDTQTLALKTQSGGTPEIVLTVNAPSQTATGASTVAAVVIENHTSTVKTIQVSTGGTNLGSGGSGPSFSTARNGLPVKRAEFAPKSGKPTIGGGAVGTLRPGQIGYKSPQGGTGIGSGGGPSLNWTGGPTTGGFKRAANAVAQMALGRTGNRRGFSAPSSQSQFVRRNLRPGDEVYVYDLEAGILDTANQITYRGETISPALVRCTLMTWPLEQGLGVYIRSNAASPTLIDITPFVQWEAPGAQIDVSDWTPAAYGTANRANGAVETRVAGTSPIVSWSSVTVTQSGSVAGTINSGWYVKHGDGTFEAHLTWTASAGGSAGNIITVTTPLTLSDAEYVHGTLTVSAATNRAAIVYPNNTTTVRFMCEGSTSLLGSNPAYTIANTNVFRLYLTGRYA